MRVKWKHWHTHAMHDRLLDSAMLPLSSVFCTLSACPRPKFAILSQRLSDFKRTCGLSVLFIDLLGCIVTGYVQMGQDNNSVRHTRLGRTSVAGDVQMEQAKDSELLEIVQRTCLRRTRGSHQSRCILSRRSSAFPTTSRLLSTTPVSSYLNVTL